MIFASYSPTKENIQKENTITPVQQEPACLSSPRKAEWMRFLCWYFLIRRLIQLPSAPKQKVRFSWTKIEVNNELTQSNLNQPQTIKFIYHSYIPELFLDILHMKRHFSKTAYILSTQEKIAA